MRKRFSKVLTLTALILTVALVASPMGTVFASIADGTYEVNYEMKEAGSDSTSIADGYFTKPATLTVQDGVQYIQLTVTSASMIKSLSGPSGAVDVVSEGDDTRVVKFRVDGDLSQPVTMNMHIVVPDMPAMPGGYDQDHTARAVFNVSDLPAAGAGEATEQDEDAKDDANKEDASEAAGASKVDNPPTGDNTPVALYVTLLLASIGIFTIYKVRAARN